MVPSFGNPSAHMHNGKVVCVYAPLCNVVNCLSENVFKEFRDT
jgi:hypothetical protein